MSSNYRTGLQALLAAQAGVLHAQNTVDGYGPSRFDTEILPQWGTLFGTSPRTMSGYANISYTVAPASDTVDPASYMLLTATGQAPGESQRLVDVRLKRSGVYSPGAIYMPSDSVSTNFNGNKFLVDGHNTRLNGTPDPSGDVPGITTRNDTARDGIRSALSSQQAGNVVGVSGDPSVETANGFTVDRLRNELLPAILARPGVVTNPSLKGHDVFGTTLLPQITHFTGNVTINGTVDGAGILIVDQGLTVSGDMTFTGLIIVGGTTQITAIQGNTTILGAVWTTDLQLSVAGSASATYSTEALALANVLADGSLPQKVKVVAWRDR